MFEEQDILVKNVSIIDGTGAPAFKGDIAVRGKRIATILKVEEDLNVDAKEVINAKRLIASPGFIDVHSHGDLSILYYPRADGLIRQGITTFVGGNCGNSSGPFGDFIGLPWVLSDLYSDLAPKMFSGDWLIPRDLLNTRHRELFGWEIDWNTMGEYFGRVEAKGLSPNFAPLVGQGDVRSLVMGPDFEREATRDEIKEMTVHVERAMEDGCIGISVGRDYDPGIWASFDEILACAEIVAKYDGVFTSHGLSTGQRKARRPGESPPIRTKGVLEAIEVGRRAKISVQISHLRSLYDIRPGNSDIMTEAAVRATLTIIDNARREGIDIHFDLIPNRLRGIETNPWLVSYLAPWIRVAGSLEQFANALNMPDFREEIKEAIWAGKHYGLNPNRNERWANRRIIVECKDARFLDRTVANVAEEFGIDQLDALMKILMIDPRTKAVRKVGIDLMTLRLYEHSEMMIGTDTFAIDETRESRCPPWNFPIENSFGGFPCYLRRAVRETGTLSLEEAVRKITRLPAKKFKLADRGILKTGAYADIVLFNFETVTDKGNQLNPRQYPTGIEHVIVNGVLVVKNSKHTGALPGEILYRE